MQYAKSLKAGTAIQENLPVLHRVRIVKLLTQNVLEATHGYPPMAVLLAGGRATSRQFAFVTGSKWVATFPLA